MSEILTGLFQDFYQIILGFLMLICDYLNISEILSGFFLGSFRILLKFLGSFKLFFDFSC